jgi:UDP-N-acetylmuramoylalanine-D-glutamate ligase
LLDRYDVYLAGNTENSFSSILVSLLDRSTTKPILFVLEVSSFMLYNLQNFVFDVGVFINISQDHLDRHGTMKHYWESKYTMVSHSMSSVIGKSLVDTISLTDTIRVAEPVSITNHNLLGDHNQENLSVAYTALTVFMEKHDISYTST